MKIIYIKSLPTLILILGILSSNHLTGQSTCDSLPEYRAFDFWVGEWDVYLNDEKIAESTISHTSGNCGIIENYRPLNRAGGNSISYYDPAAKKWKQDWVTVGQVSHYVEPDDYTEGDMQLIARHHTKEGDPFLLRMIYYADEVNNTVRQLMDRSDNEGKTWKTIFDGLYKAKTSENKSSGQAESTIRQIQKDFVNGWKTMDEEKIMALMDKNARLHPDGINPITGNADIREYWFPKDGSKTIINEYNTEILSLNILDTLAVSTQKSMLDWTYEKDTIRFSRLQKGIGSMIYKKQPDNSWKIWRSIWMNLSMEKK
ncbi:hypothetical protein OOZ15_07650 [Galbibacter sp. EGI 63066]|uniref:YybH family protein n=1 Tax=Galbibacter sp. EGI 63066 TaxID=2993559 RepID=UPI00224893CC|nr:hypothetical protein [Galbibacter sp. EGI 63066]MCX2679807.1 hypothetical protein [Galbibacter sp. EGI 63066]